MTKWNRRTFLRASGLAGAAALLPSLHAIRSRAQTTAPKRLIVIAGNDGAIRGEKAALPSSGMSAPSRYDFELPEWLTGLRPYKDRMIYFNNIDMISADIQPPGQPGGGSAHDWGASHFLSPFPRAAEAESGGESFDQFVARGLYDSGVVTPLRSWHITVSTTNSGWSGSGYDDAVGTPFLLGPGQHIGGHNRVDRSYDNVFRPEWRPATTMEPAPTEPTETVAEERRRIVLDRSLARHQALIAAMPARDRELLVAHHDMLQEAVRRESGEGRMVNPTALWPERDATLAPYAGVSWGGTPDTSDAEDRWHATIDGVIPLIGRAFQFDLTRVVGIHWESSPYSELGFTNGMYGADSDPHWIAHTANGVSSGFESHAQANEIMSFIRRDKIAISNGFRALVESLASLEDVDGSSVLDNTVILFTSHIADGSHMRKYCAWWTLGNWGGALRTGQYLDLPRRPLASLPGVGAYSFTDGSTPEVRGVSVGQVGRSHLDLFHTLATAMEVPNPSSFGWNLPFLRGGTIDEMLA